MIWKRDSKSIRTKDQSYCIMKHIEMRKMLETEREC